MLICRFCFYLWTNTRYKKTLKKLHKLGLRTAFPLFPKNSMHHSYIILFNKCLTLLWTIKRTIIIGSLSWLNNGNPHWYDRQQCKWDWGMYPHPCGAQVSRLLTHYFYPSSHPCCVAEASCESRLKLPDCLPLAECERAWQTGDWRWGGTSSPQRAPLGSVVTKTFSLCAAIMGKVRGTVTRAGEDTLLRLYSRYL